MRSDMRRACVRAYMCAVMELKRIRIGVNCGVRADSDDDDDVVVDDVSDRLGAPSRGGHINLTVHSPNAQRLSEFCDSRFTCG